MAMPIQRQVVELISVAPFLTILIDETTYASNKEDMLSLGG